MTNELPATWEEYVAFCKNMADGQYDCGVWSENTPYEAMFYIHKYGHSDGFFIFKNDHLSPIETSEIGIASKFKFHTPEAGNGVVAHQRGKEIYDVMVAGYEAARQGHIW